MKLIKYVETVEIPTNNTTKTKFYFREQPNLRNKKIIFIDTWREFYVTKGPSGLSVVNNTIFGKSFLVLVSKGKEVINRIPIYHLDPVVQRVKKVLFDLEIDFPKSYIEIGSIASLSATETFVLTFYCHDTIKEEPEYRGLNIENIEVATTPAINNKFYFPDHENLRNKRVQILDYIYDVNVSMTPSGDNIVNSPVRKKSFLTIASKGQEIIRKMPIYSLLIYGSGCRIPFDNIEIDFPNSYFEVPDTVDTVAGEKFFLNVYFYDHVSKNSDKPGLDRKLKFPPRMRRHRR